MTDERLAELERVARAAGGQPWAEARADLGNIYTGQPTRAGVVIRLDADGDETERAIFAHLEAANPATLLALVAEVRRLRAALVAAKDLVGLASGMDAMGAADYAEADAEVSRIHALMDAALGTLA